jgi:hypothetical protein
MAYNTNPAKSTLEVGRRWQNGVYREMAAAASSVDGKEGGDTVTDRADARAGSHRTLKIAVLQSYALGT